MTRSLLLVVNDSRPQAVTAATEMAAILYKAGLTLLTVGNLKIDHVSQVALTDISECEIALVLGGDGTILRGAEIVQNTNIPLLGINLGHVGFLAEVEKAAISEIAKAIIDKSYVTDSRLLLAVSVERAGKIVNEGFALNEVTVERSETAMVELFLQIDNRPISRWGCDGLICATPTGSTAYAFSAGGPIIWPEVEALVVLPIAAHALFAKPLVISPDSRVVVDIESQSAVLSADGLRKFPLLAKDRITIVRNEQRVRLAHLKETNFSDRLVAKFKLPVEGWRGE
jgi:NAD+ kinase